MNSSSKKTLSIQNQEGSPERETQERNEAKENQNKTTEGKTVDGFTGKVLAGTSAPFIIFNLPDYEKALQSNKVIVLDFYANWCPICRAESPELHAGFDALNTNQVIGFRINYNDSDTDNDEKDLARKYAITLQHTKIILKNSKEVFRTLESWDKPTFLREVNKALAS